MSKINRATCFCPITAIAKKNSLFGGTVIDSSKTNAMRYSEITRVRNSRYGSIRYINTDINAFGYYSGGPGGSGAPPRNSF